jgi:hypothetical protein
MASSAKFASIRLQGCAAISATRATLAVRSAKDCSIPVISGTSVTVGTRNEAAQQK